MPVKKSQGAVSKNTEKSAAVSTLKSEGGVASHAGDLRLSLFLLQAVFIHVGEDAGTAFLQPWEAAAGAHRERRLPWREGAAEGPADRTGRVAVHRSHLHTPTVTNQTTGEVKQSCCQNASVPEPAPLDSSLTAFLGLPAA